MFEKGYDWVGLGPRGFVWVMLCQSGFCPVGLGPGGFFWLIRTSSNTETLLSIVYVCTAEVTMWRNSHHLSMWFIILCVI